MPTINKTKEKKTKFLQRSNNDVSSRLLIGNKCRLGDTQKVLRGENCQSKILCSINLSRVWFLQTPRYEPDKIQPY